MTPALEEAHRLQRLALRDRGTFDLLLPLPQATLAAIGFHAQQAAEKSIKAVWLREDADPWGHSVKKLIDDLESVNLTVHQYFAQYARAGLVLDRFYIPTRYPNGLPDLTPAEAFVADDAANCVLLAEIIVEAVHRYLA